MLVQTSPEDFLRSVDAAKAERRRQRDLDRADDDRKLDPWERYRVLTDHVDSLHDRSEQVDRKTRFALLILGGVNAINLAVVLRGGEFGLRAGHDLLITTYAASYVLLSLGFFCDAIAALRPRHAAPGSTPVEARGLTSPDAVIGITLDEYRERWTGARLSSVNAELASMAYATTLENGIKLRALRRVYWGLYVLVGLTAAFLAALAVMGARPGV